MAADEVAELLEADVGEVTAALASLVRRGLAFERLYPELVKYSAHPPREWVPGHGRGWPGAAAGTFGKFAEGSEGGVNQREGRR